MERVIVLLDEVLGLVADSAGKVADQETVLVPDLPVLLQLGLARQVQPKMHSWAMRRRSRALTP